MSPFTSEIYVPGARIRNSPAAVNRRTGRLMLNRDTFDTLPENTKAFIRHHEAGHLVLDTTNELSADAYAFEKMMAEGRSLKDCVHALTSLLTESEGHRLRALVTLNRAKAHDHIKNGNKPIMQQNNRADKVEYLFGKKKKGKAPSAKKQARQQKRADKRAAKKEKQAIKLDKKRAKNENIRSRAQSRIILAEQGEQMGLGAIAKGVGGILSGNGGGPADIIPETIQQGLSAAAALGTGALKQPEQVYTETGAGYDPGRGAADSSNNARGADPDPEGDGPEPGRPDGKKKKKDNTALYIGLGIGALVLVVALIFILKK